MHLPKSSRTAIGLFMLSILTIGCSSPSSKVATLDYLGQTPPGKTATLFAPGIVSTDRMEHSAPAFSPDGTVVVWSVIPDGFAKPAYFLEMNYVDGIWSSAHRVSFNDSTADDYYPSFSVDGNTMFFSSRRKMPAGYTQTGDMRIWKVERKDRAWGVPVPLDTTVSRGREFAHSVTQDGSIFFSAGFFNEALNGKTGWSIYKSQKNNDQYHEAARLPYSLNSMGYEDGPFVAPDESFLIFESDRPEGLGGTDLYISFKSEAERWSRPVNMGPAINSSYFERFARLSPDGKYLFFGSSRDEKEGHPGFDIYWIDASVIEDLRNSSTAAQLIESVLGEHVLAAMDKGEWAQAAILLNEWLSAHPNDADAVFNYSVALKKQKMFEQAEEFLRSRASLFAENASYQLEVALLNLALNREEPANRILAPLLAEKDKQWNRYIYISTSLFDMEQFAASDAYLNKAMDISMWSYGYYKQGAAYARIGERERAFANLLLAIRNGFNEKQHFDTDLELASLKTDSRWQQLMEELK